MKKLGLAALALVVSTSANAAFQNGTWQNAGDVTLDTESNLEWLDLTITVNKSYSEVSGALGTTYAGFRYASAAEMAALWQHAGFTLAVESDLEILQPAPAGFYDKVDTFVSYFGNTSPAPSTPFGDSFDSSGLYGADDGMGNHYYNSVGYGAFFISTAWGQNTVGPGAPGSIAYGDNTPLDFVGHWLVRDTAAPPVPLPAAAWLLMSGMGAIGAVARRRAPSQSNQSLSLRHSS